MDAGFLLLHQVSQEISGQRDVGSGISAHLTLNGQVATEADVLQSSQIGGEGNAALAQGHFLKGLAFHDHFLNVTDMVDDLRITIQQLDAVLGMGYFTFNLLLSFVF